MNVDGYIDKIKQNAGQTFMSTGLDYYDEDGILHCGICGDKKVTRLQSFGKTWEFTCLCKCAQEKLKLYEAQMKREEMLREVEHLKSVGLSDHRFREWCFANDNGCNPKLYLAREYVEKWQEMKEQNIGYLLSGPVGTGKSFFAGCIANALMEKGIPVLMTNFSRILNEMTCNGADKNQIIQNLVSYPLLIIDDLGVERRSEFATEQVYSIIDSRYCSKRPLIVTTNLTVREMENAELEYQRIYSRIFEMCIPVVYEGNDLRKKEAKGKIQYITGK